MENKLLEIVNRLENIVDRNSNYIEDVSIDLKEDLALESYNELERKINEIKKNGRELKIGIVGRVKAGKSSLLNSLFFNGKNILPKAATPMTAALTILSYGEEFSYEVDFYNEEDIKKIKEGYEKYKEKKEKWEKIQFENLKKINKLGKSDEELKKLAERSVARALKEETTIQSLFEQYTKMKESGLLSSISNMKNVKAPVNDLEDLKNKLNEYVGANGRYMPFTKSIKLTLNIESLKDITIVDTPGLNDPVVSREERTRQELSYCDVTLIISPAGQFLSSEDKELMDRISTKEGINELYVIASQVDTQLYGSEKEKNNGVLPDVLESLSNLLNEQLVKITEDIKEENPEVGNTFDKLLEGNKVVLSSGIAEAIFENFNKKDDWDEGMQHVWQMLLTEYPEYFSDTNEKTSLISLEKLSNLRKIKNIIDEVRNKKDEILQEKINTLVEAKLKNYIEYKEKLIKEIDYKIESLNNTDIDKLKKRINELENKKESLKDITEEIYEEQIYSLVDKLNFDIKEYLNKKRRELENAINVSTDTEIQTYTALVKQKGLFGSVKRFFGGFFSSNSGYDEVEKTRSCQVLKTNYIASSLREISRDMSIEIGNDTTNNIREFKKILQKEFVKEFFNVFENEDEMFETINLMRSIRKSIRMLDINCQIEMIQVPKELKNQGTISGNTMENYLVSTREFLIELSNNYRKYSKNVIDNMSNKLKSLDPFELLYKNIKEENDKLLRETENIKVTIDSYDRMKKEINKIKRK